MRLLKSVSENFVGIEDSEGRKLQGMVGSRSHAEPSLTPSPQESESVSDEAPSDPLLLAILVHLLCCPLGNAALPCSSQVGMCVSTSITHGSVIQDCGFEHSFELDSRIWFVVSAYFKCVALCLPILMAVL